MDTTRLGRADLASEYMTWGAERGGAYSNKRAKTNDAMLTRTTSCAEASGRLMSACTATIVISAPLPPCAPLCEAPRRKDDSFLAESRELPVRSVSTGEPLSQRQSQ